MWDQMEGSRLEVGLGWDDVVEPLGVPWLHMYPSQKHC